MLRIIEQRHEPEIHVQLLMAVEECEAGVVGDEIDVGFLVTAEHDDVFENSG